MYIIGLANPLAAERYFGALAERLLQIDSTVYPEVLQGTPQGGYGRCTDKETIICASRDGVIVGYCILLPIGDTLYRDITERHVYRDDDISSGELAPSYSNVFLLSVAILPEYQNSDVTQEIRSKILEFLEEQAVHSLSACVVSESGVKFLKSLGAEEIAKTREGHTIMERIAH